MLNTIRVLILLVLFTQVVIAQEVVVRDSVNTGYKAPVNKLGTKFGLGVDATPASSVFEGKVNVTTAGTRVQISGSSVPIRSVCIKALHADTGKIYIGDVTVASSNGYELVADISVCADVNNLNLLYIDSSVNGEGVTYFAVN